MIGKNVGLTIGVIGMALISVLGSAWGTYDTLNILSKDIPRSFLITLTLEGAIVIFAVWCLLANDRWTFALTMLLFLFYVAVAIGFQIVNANLHAAEGRVVAVGSEGVRWAIRHLAFVPPTVPDTSNFIVPDRSLITSVIVSPDSFIAVPSESTNTHTNALTSFV